jgi:LMBR1 domain-containing protein 1
MEDNYGAKPMNFCHLTLHSSHLYSNLIINNIPGCEGFNTAVCGGLNMELFWNIIYWLIPAWVFILIPFCTFYYEADDGMLMAGTSIGAKPKSKIREALCYEMFVVVIFGLIFALTYLFLNTTDIPVRDWTGPGFEAGPLYSITEVDNATFSTDQLNNMGAKDVVILNANTVNPEMSSISISVNPATFYAGLMAWLGWFLFACFGGIGMAALPLDLILQFVNRPHHMDAVEFAEAQRLLRDRVNELVTVGELLKMEREENAQKNETKGWREQRKAAAEEKKAWLQFKQAVYLMEEDAEEFANCTENYRNYNPLIPIFALLAGICALIISLCWVLQIILYMLPNPPVTPFLNDYFRWFETWFNLFGVLSVAIFSFYLLICAVKGCFKFGLRFLFFQVHPMKLNKTYMSSFLFNIGLVLLCALPVVQFSASAFQDYARYTTVSQTFNVQLYYLKFFGWFWRSKVFEYALLVILLLTCIYLGCKPKDTAGGKDSIGLRDRLRARSS